MTQTIGELSFNPLDHVPPATYPSVMIEQITPQIDGGRYPIKRIVGDIVTVQADIYKEGHDDLAALLKWRKRGTENWNESPMTFLDNDRWQGSFQVTENAYYEYTIEAYAEKYLSWVHELHKKNIPGANILSELLEGVAIIRTSIPLAQGHDRAELQQAVNNMTRAIDSADQNSAIAISTSEWCHHLMGKYPNRSESYTYEPYLTIMVNRKEARFAAWYEFFPRSAGTDPNASATWDDCINRLYAIKEMGFNVIYFPPIHPIGITHRKGRNNSLTAQPGEPGCPYAIGNEHGGHTGMEPSLGDFAGFERFRQKSAELGFEIALDFVTNCSPDHPYVTEHPDWFYHRPDGSIKYAENPPKKYQDVYPLNFYTEDREGLWQEMLRIFLFWVSKGVKTFRIDNPHTKPVPFWEWVIAEVHREHPDVIFLAEAFTKPKMMKMLAKAGYAQSYTYFTWRNSKDELINYGTELTQTEMQEYFTGNFFANTPDILPTILQIGGRPAFIMRLILAGTLSSVYGIYSGFELCENRAMPGKEEYLDSEKYQYKVWDWDREGNIKDIVGRVNYIRNTNPAMQRYDNLRFIDTENSSILGYYKMTEDKSNILVVVVNLDPFHRQNSFIHLPIDQFGIGENELYQVQDLLNDEYYLWRGRKNFVDLTPNVKQAHIFRIRRWSHYENGFDYFM